MTEVAIKCGGYLQLDTDDFVLMTDNTVTVVIHCTWNLPYQSKFYLFKL